MRKHIVFRLLFWLCCLLVIAARPTNLQEASSSFATRLFTGAGVGVETILALLGYYDEVETDVTNESPSCSSAYQPTQMQVVALGLGRTGTTSLALALEILGYTVIHDDESVDLRDLYVKEWDGEISWDDFHVLAGERGYNASFKTDYEWVMRHPEVKSILTLRDTPDHYVKSWLSAASFVDTVQQRPFCWMPATKKLLPSWIEEYKLEPTGGQEDKYLDPDTLRQGYMDYLDTVKKAIPADRLLEFNVKQGWEPLCEFLGKPVPKGIPFPHVHDRVKLVGEQLVLQVLTWVWPLFILVPLLLLTVATRFLTKKLGRTETNFQISLKKQKT